MNDFDSRKKKLAALGAERLADVLLDLASTSATAERMVVRLTAGADEKVRRYKSGLAKLRRRTHFVYYSEAEGFAQQLVALLELLDDEALDPATGLQLVADFYRSDAKILEMSDDSNGAIGDVFRYEARDRLERFAQQCTDKTKVADVVFELMSKDSYGVRDAILTGLTNYLPTQYSAMLVDRMWTAAQGEYEFVTVDEHWRANAWLLNLELVAYQLRDTDLFERARRAQSSELSMRDRIDIARARLDTGNADAAFTMIEPVMHNEQFSHFKGNNVLKDIYRALERWDELERILRTDFHAQPSEASLIELINLVGEEHRESLMDDATTAIQNSESFSEANARFLVDQDRIEDLSRYVIAQRESVNGDHWYELKGLAHRLRDEGHAPAASVIYRALLDSILNRGRSPAYQHGLRYLRHLDQLADGIENWGDMPPHADYFEALRKQHGRKWSFWGIYDGDNTG